MHLVALLEQELGQIGTILTGDSRDQGNSLAHRLSFDINSSGRSAIAVIHARRDRPASAADAPRPEPYRKARRTTAAATPSPETAVPQRGWPTKSNAARASAGRARKAGTRPDTSAGCSARWFHACGPTG